MYQNEIENDAAESPRNSLLNYIKGCACICVIFMHACFPGITGRIIYQIAQFAVPVFFMISGYFSYDRHENHVQRIVKRIRRISVITIVSVSIYFLYTLFVMLQADCVGQWFATFTDYKWWINLLLFGNLDIVGCAHLWFLIALIYSYLILWLLISKKWDKYINKLLPILIMMRIVISVMVLSFNLSWHYRGNFLVGGLPWLLLGYYFASSKDLYKKIANKKLMIAGICGVLFSIFFVSLPFTIDLSEVGTIVFSSSLFLLAVKNPTKSVNLKIEKLGDTYSLYVYIIHILLISIYDHKLLRIGKQNDVFILWTKPIVIVILSIAVSILFKKVLDIGKAKKEKLVTWVKND